MFICDLKLLETIYEDAKNRYPNECCGILLGERDTGGCREGKQIYKVKNETKKNIQQHFMIEAAAILEAERIAEEHGYEIVGCYHSHINCKAVASREDSKFAIPGLSYLIVSVRNGQIGELTSWEKYEIEEIENDESLVEEMIKIKD